MGVSPRINLVGESPHLDRICDADSDLPRKRERCSEFAAPTD